VYTVGPAAEAKSEVTRGRILKQTDGALTHRSFFGRVGMSAEIESAHYHGEYKHKRDNNRDSHDNPSKYLPSLC
jgi:hypothetical protein